MDDIEIMKTAIKTFGPQLQTVVAIEEMSELQKELTKFLRGNGKKKHLTEEVADALIMITQIQIIYQTISFRWLTNIMTGTRSFMTMKSGVRTL